ncbi:MAG TPA: SHOCT domain-containing protein [Jiangellaceae bacterium]
MDDYPLLDVFFSMLWFFLFVAWIFLLVMILSDVFRSDDFGGWSKALWALFIIILPILGCFIYLIARGQGMAERRAYEYRQQQEAFRSYVQETAQESTSSAADELAKLAQLRDAGNITPDEFAAQKAKLLAT